MAGGGEPIEVVEVAHEALLRQWETLERWLREFVAALSAAESMRRSANDWQRSHGDEALLVHTAHRLQAAEALLSDERLEGRFEPIDRDYLAACRQRDQQAAARARGAAPADCANSRRHVPSFNGVRHGDCLLLRSWCWVSWYGS